MTPTSAHGQGDRYDAGDADQEIIAGVVTESATRHGFLVSRLDKVDGSVQLDGRQSARWLSVTLRALPQRLRWLIQRESTTTVRFDRWSDTWYRWLVVLACIVSAIIYWVSLYRMTVPGYFDVWLGFVAVVATSGMIFVNWRWIAAGSLHVERLWDTIHTELRAQGMQLDYKPHLSRPRIRRVGTMYLGFVAVAYVAPMLVAGGVRSGALARAPIWLIAIVGLLAVIGGALATVLVHGIRRPGFEHRLRPMVPGIAGLMAVLVVLATQIPCQFSASIPDDMWATMFVAQELDQQGRTVFEVKLLSGKSVNAAEVRHALGVIKLMMTVSIFLIPLGWAIALICAVPSLRSLTLVLRHCRRLSEAVDMVTMRKAVSGEGFLGRFRASLILVWVAASAVVAWGMWNVIKAGFFAVCGMPHGWTSGGRDVAGVAAHALKLIFGLPPDSLVPEVISRWFWAAWSIAMFLLVTVSVGSWLTKRRRTRRELRRASRSAEETDIGRRLREIIADLGVRPSPRVALVADAMPTASAHEFGLCVRERYIAVTTRSIEILDGGEIRALIAHECGHLVEGHCRKHSAMQVLGRLSFVGDAFVGAIEHSFGYELAADQAAVIKFGIEPNTLGRCLLKLRAVATLQKLHGSLHGEGIGAVSQAEPVTGAAGPHRKLFGRVADVFRLWLRLYTSETTVSYWHPAVEERIRALGVRIGRSPVEDASSCCTTQDGEKRTRSDTIGAGSGNDMVERLA